MPVYRVILHLVKSKEQRDCPESTSYQHLLSRPLNLDQSQSAIRECSARSLRDATETNSSHFRESIFN
jgi:hypothetical protein